MFNNKKYKLKKIIYKQIKIIERNLVLKLLNIII